MSNEYEKIITPENDGRFEYYFPGDGSVVGKKLKNGKWAISADRNLAFAIEFIIKSR